MSLIHTFTNEEFCVETRDYCDGVIGARTIHLNHNDMCVEQIINPSGVIIVNTWSESIGDKQTIMKTKLPRNKIVKVVVEKKPMGRPRTGTSEEQKTRTNLLKVINGIKKRNSTNHPKIDV